MVRMRHDYRLRSLFQEREREEEEVLLVNVVTETIRRIQGREEHMVSSRLWKTDEQCIQLIDVVFVEQFEN